MELNLAPLEVCWLHYLVKLGCSAVELYSVEFSNQSGTKSFRYEKEVKELYTGAGRVGQKTKRCSDDFQLT